MALSGVVASHGGAVGSLSVKADVTLGPDKVDGGFKLTGITLTVRADISGLSVEEFALAAEEAKKGCPLSKALAGVDITLDAALIS
jgi:osmotically inducible protein OsmC